MAKRIELPQTPQGTEEEQLRAMYSYLYQMAVALNSNLAEIGGSELTDDEMRIMREVLDEPEAEGPAGYNWREAETLKSMIIKTAQFVRTAIDEYNMKLIGTVEAEGTLGRYVRNTGMDVAVNPEGITQRFSFQEIIQGLKTFEINSKNYIKSGLLRTEHALPVYGVAIGKDIVTFDEDGTETYNDGNKVAELTADELSFWQNGTKIASYIGNEVAFYQGNGKVMSLKGNELAFFQNGQKVASFTKDGHTLYQNGQPVTEFNKDQTNFYNDGAVRAYMEDGKFYIPDEIYVPQTDPSTQVQTDIPVIYTMNGIRTDMEDGFGNRYTKEETAEYVMTQIQDAEGNYYTKTETSNLVTTEIGDALGNYYTKSETATEITTRMNSALGNYYTKTETAEYVHTEMGTELEGYIQKTTTLRTADAIVSEAVRQAGTNAANGYIAKTTSYQTADSIVNEAVRQAGTSASSAYIAKTTTYQTADAIYSAAQGYTNGQLSSYSTTNQTSTMIANYVTDNAYKKQSGITITASGIDISGSQYVSIASGGYFNVTTSNFGIDTRASAGYAIWAYNGSRYPFYITHSGGFYVSNSYMTIDTPSAEISMIKGTAGTGTYTKWYLNTKGLWATMYSTSMGYYEAGIGRDSSSVQLVTGRYPATYIGMMDYYIEFLIRDTPTRSSAGKITFSASYDSSYSRYTMSIYSYNRLTIGTTYAQLLAVYAEQIGSSNYRVGNGYFTNLNTTSLTVNGSDVGTTIASMSGHINSTSNPHSVTASQIGAAPAIAYGAENILRSSNNNVVLQAGGYKLKMQADGNLVIYNSSDRAIWSTGTGGQ